MVFVLYRCGQGGGGGAVQEESQEQRGGGGAPSSFPGAALRLPQPTSIEPHPRHRKRKFCLLTHLVGGLVAIVVFRCHPGSPAYRPASCVHLPDTCVRACAI